nr:ribonuclease H-like domain-containing protein [Tanacetum cinerariifolium]
MDQDSTHMVAASKVLMLKPSVFEIWRMRIEKYIEMVDYALWEVIENGATLPKTQVVEGVTIVTPITSVEDKDQRRLEVKARNTLMMGIPNEHQLKFNSIKDANHLLEAAKKRFGGNAATKKIKKSLEVTISELYIEDVNQNFLRRLSTEWNTPVVIWRNKDDLETMSMDNLYNYLEVYEPEVKGTANGVSTANTQVNTSFSSNIDNLSDIVICAFLDSQPNSPQLAHEDLEQIYLDDIEDMDLRWKMAILTIRARRFLNKTGRRLTIIENETIRFDKSNIECYNCHKRRHFAREYKALRNQDTKHKESTRRRVSVESPASTALVSCAGLGGYDWSD